MVDVVHQQTAEVDVVHGLAGKALTVNEHEHALPAESVEVHVHLLVTGIAELDARDGLLQQVLEVGGIGHLYLPAAYNLSLHRRL